MNGIDPCGADWSYSRATCLRNAEERGVGQRISFIPGSAAGLPFEAESFDAVVSNLAFQEVSDVADKRRLLHESLRVLRKGGAFSLQDLFFDPRLYGPVDALIASLRASGARDVHIIALHQRIQIPPLLSGRRVLGAAGILFGTK